MLMKVNHWIAVLFVGFLLNVFASWMKIVHRPNANAVMAISFVTIVVAAAFLVVWILRDGKRN